MPRSRTLSATIPANNRSRVGNGSRVLEGIKLQSALGRRYRELVESYTQEFETTSAVDVDLIRMAAGLVIKNEAMTAATIRGEAVAADDMIKLAGQLRRVLADLKRRAALSETTTAPSILDHYAQQQVEEDENAEEEA